MPSGAEIISCAGQRIGNDVEARIAVVENAAESADDADRTGRRVPGLDAGDEGIADTRHAHRRCARPRRPVGFP